MNGRIYFFDAMRALLIISIVIIHISQVFNPEKSWLISNEKSIVLSPYLIDFLMLFTLKSFFIMSGYLAAMSIKKVGINTFFDLRIKRILVPIFVAVITLNSLQAYFLTQFGGIDFNLYDYITKGKWISHLWFLIDLSIFFFLTYISLSFSFFKPILLQINNFFKKMNIYIIIVVLSMTVVFLFAFFSLTAQYIQNSIINISSLFFYFPFFIFGILLFLNQNIFKNFINIPLFSTTLIACISVYLTNELISINKVAYYFFYTASGFFTSALLFTLFYKIFNRKSKFFSFLADASYSVYLFHHVLIIFGTIVFMHLELNPYLVFLLLLLFVLFLTLFIHHFLISKNSILGFLYNGKKIKKDAHG